MNYYLNVALVGSSTKKRCQDVTRENTELLLNLIGWLSERCEGNLHGEERLVDR